MLVGSKVIVALGLLVKDGYGFVMKPVDAVGHFVFVLLEESGSGTDELVRDPVVSGDSPEPEEDGPDPAVTVTVCQVRQLVKTY